MPVKLGNNNNIRGGGIVGCYFGSNYTFKTLAA
jgi:hypothetical protein